jgi:hypothetical protein
MVKNNYFAHTSPAGISPWYWFVNVGYNFTAAGENLAVDFSDSADVTSAWMNSPEHRANILNGGFTEIGMATAQGTFEGRQAVYVVELFGTPAAAVASLAPAVRPPVAVASKPAAKPAVKPVVATGSEMFASVKGAETQVAVTTGTAAVSSVAAAESNPVQTATADPRATVNLFYFAIAAVFAAALILDIFIKIRIQHPAPILGGAIVIAMVELLVVLNYQIVLLHAAII